jgi:hypothetical protein
MVFFFSMKGSYRLACMGYQGCPTGIVPQDLGIADYQQARARPGETHINAALVRNEANSSRSLLRSHCAEDDNVSFAALEAIDGIDIHLFEELRAETAQEFFTQQVHLAWKRKRAA